MSSDIKAEAARLAADPDLSDYDFWRSLKNLNNEIFQISQSSEPIPFSLLRRRAILKQARMRRSES